MMVSLISSPGIIHHLFFPPGRRAGRESKQAKRQAGWEASRLEGRVVRHVLAVSDFSLFNVFFT